MESFSSSEGFFTRNKKKTFIATGLIALIVLAFSIMAIRKEVVLVCDGEEAKITSFSSNVEGLLVKRGIQMAKEDKVTPGLEEKLTRGARVVVSRAFEVNLIQGQEKEVIKTAENTVEDLLNSLDIKLSKEDRVEPGLKSKIGPGDDIELVRVTKEIVTEREEIPYQIRAKYNDSMDYGKTNLIQEGKAGSKEITFELTYENGIQLEKKPLYEKVLEEPTHELVEKGTAKMLLTSRGDTRRYKDVVVMEASAYTADYASTGKRPGDPYFGITRSGTKVRPGVVAVDPRVIPLGSKLYIESMDSTSDYGLASAEDTGGAIKGNKIDLYFENRSDALRFGRRNVKVYILN